MYDIFDTPSSRASGMSAYEHLPVDSREEFKVIHLEIILGNEKLFRRPLKLVKCMPQQPLEKRETRCCMRLPVNSDLFGNGDVDGICDSLPSILFLLVLIHCHADNFATQACILLVHGR